MDNETIIANLAGMADLASGHMSFSQELESLGQEAINAVNASPEYFTGPQGAPAYQQVMSLIHQAVQDGQEVIARHGNAIDTAAGNSQATDGAIGQSFTSI
ncbi:uncharacterized protein YukE [Mycobacterium sp. OAS707]|jgi:uncharacterized protein YukE|uniref:WXG100 family type VII secretion target n=1 Tax=unclassified Mycobacterium TaxID=2642494 RepID=UPI001788FBFE|nr:hypothetical protein [Mycobacterium sp. OAS707]MBE1551791.1 uncharacterized protein YukE [Mycobacterium sp. OAS707]